MSGIIIGSFECPLEKFLEVLTSADNEQVNIGKFPISQWKEFAGYLDLPPHMLQKFSDQITHENEERYEAMKCILGYWIINNGYNANLGTMLSIIEGNFKWEIVTDFLRKQIQQHAKNFNDLDDWSKEWLLNIHFVFLGRQTSLNTLREVVSKQAFEEILDTIDNSFIAGVLHNNLRQFDKFALPLDSPRYMNRTVELKRKLNPDIFQKACEDVFIFENTRHYDLSFLVRPNTADVSGGQLEHLTVRFILLESEDHVTKIVENATNSVHRIQYKDNCYYWTSSYGPISIIREYLSDELEVINEATIISQSLSNFNPMPFAICGGTGSGKSVLLASLANQIFHKHSERYAIFLDFPKIFEQQILRNKIQMSSSRTELVSEIIGMVFKMHKFAQTIFEELMKNSNPFFVIFLDKIDDVPLENFGLVKKFLKLLLEYPNMRIFLTFGPAIRQELENNLQILSSDIVPFCEDEIESFVSKMANFHVGRLVLKSVDLISKIRSKHKKTAVSPLQCYMLVEVYSKTTTNKYDASGEIKWSKSPIKSITELYSRYLGLKFREMGNQDVEPLKLLHYRAAFNKLFPDNIHAEPLLQALDKQINQFDFSSNPNETALEHKTFFEYLLAEFIVHHRNASGIDEKSNLSTFIYKTLLITCKAEQSDEIPDILEDLENDTLESVLTEMGTVETLVNMSAFKGLVKLGWETKLKHLQTSVREGQLVFQHSAICYFVNEILANKECLTLKSYAQPRFTVCVNSHDHFGLISKDLISKVLVSAKFSYKHLFRLTTELFRETTGRKDCYIDSYTYQTVLVLAARQDDVENFKCFYKFLEANSGRNVDSIRFRWTSLKNMIYEHTPLHEAAKRGNYNLFEYLFNIYRNKMQSLTGLIQICLSGSSKNCEQVITNKNRILRLLSSENIKYNFKNIEGSLLDGVHVKLFTKVCDMVGYTLSGKDVKWLYKFVVYYITNEEQMDLFVNWLISKGLTRLLFFFEEGHNHLVINALKQNVLGSQSLKNIYNSYQFDLCSIMYYVKNCKNQLALLKTIIDLAGGVNLNDENDSTILEWAVSIYDYDKKKYARFEQSDKANMSNRLFKHWNEQVQKVAAELREIISKILLKTGIEHIGQIQYNQNEILGKGSFGIVYSGTLNERHVAVKKIKYTPEQEERVLQETKLLRECDGHENIVKCFFVEKSASTVLIAFEICNLTLEQFVKMHCATNNEVQIRQIFYQTAKGLEFIHSKNVVHLDIRPQNILLATAFDDSIRVKTCDFGNSRKLVNNQNVKLQVSPGTVEWMGPEVSDLASVINRTLSTSADIFSLGCVFYYVLSNGKHPFGEKTADIKSNIKLHSPHVDIMHMKEPLFVHLFYLMTSQKPDSRPTAAAVIKHPIFWSEKTMLNFLVSVSNAANQPTMASKISEIMDTIENFPLIQPYYEPQTSRGWIRFLYPDVQAYVCGIGCKRKPYKGDLFFELVRAIRNMQTHHHELPENVLRAVGENQNLFMKYWLKRFAIVFEIIWLNFEKFKNDSSSGLSEYYCKEYDFNCKEVSDCADKIISQFIKKQCTFMVLQGSSF